LLCRALKIGFKKKLKGMRNPYGEGLASRKILNKIVEVPINKKLIMKKFYNLNNK